MEEVIKYPNFQSMGLKELIRGITFNNGDSYLLTMSMKLTPILWDTTSSLM
jgi:hypothetical protein